MIAQNIEITILEIIGDTSILMALLLRYLNAVTTHTTYYVS